MTGTNIEFSVRAVAAVVAALAVLLTIGSALVLRRRGELTVGRMLVLGAASCYAAAVVALTLPMQVRTGDYANLVPWYERGNILPIVTIDERTFVLNIAMTMPLGFLLPLLTGLRGVRRVALVGLAFSATVEALQYLSDVFLSSGRTADVNDLLANTLGTVLGYLVFRALAGIPALAGRSAKERAT